MSLPNELISLFAKTTNDGTPVKSETTVYGTIVEYEGDKYVKLDGSELLTPITTTVDAEPGERVTVLIKNHSATVTGNISSPAARTDTVREIGTKIDEFEIIIAGKVDTVELNAVIGRVDTLTSDNVTIKQKLTAYDADITNLKTDNVTVKGKLEAAEADIEKLVAEDATITGKLEASEADIEKLKTDNISINQKLTANTAEIKNLYAENVDISNKLTANTAEIERLEAQKLTATDADLKYANIDFSNIGKAAMEYFYANSGLIKDVTVGDATITGELVGVTIKGDLIEGNTIKADKLVVQGTDGLYYKLNFNAGNFESAEEVPTDSLHGSIITANSITAEKISVKDLVAFDATIGGFNITEKAIYSGVKESIDNTTRGTYLDNEGQIAFGDSNEYLKYYKDAEGKYHLEISASTMKFSSSGETVETIVVESNTAAKEALDKANELQNRADSGEFDAVTLRIDSSRGTVFKNNAISTVLSVVIFRGSQRITDSETMKSIFGSSAYLEWSWQKMDESSFGTIVSTDSRLGDNGFTLTLSPADINTKAVFSCSLITD